MITDEIDIIAAKIYYWCDHSYSKALRSIPIFKHSFLNTTLLTDFTFKPNFRRPSCTSKCA